MKHLLLLHGAVGSKEQLNPLKETLSNAYHVSCINFSGHGGQGLKEKFSIPQFAAEVLQWIKEKGLQKISIFGYSMGGYVALYLARFYPDSVDSIITLGTKWQWDEAVAAKEVNMLNPKVIEQKRPKFAEQLAKRHQPLDWKILLHKTATMLTEMGGTNPLAVEDYVAVPTKVLLLLGDRDKMVTLDETVAVFRQLPVAQLGVLPETYHPIETVDTQQLAYLIKKFLL